MSDSGQYLSKAEEGYWGYCDFVDRKCRISDNDLLKSIAEISERAQQIFREKQNSNSAILLRILEQTTLEDGTSDPGILLSIADSRRKQEEGLCFVKLRQF